MTPLAHSAPVLAQLPGGVASHPLVGEPDRPIHERVAIRISDEIQREDSA